jgi:pyruvate carboxylase
MAGHERDPGIDYLTIEPYDVYWAKVRKARKMSSRHPPVKDSTCLTCDVSVRAQVREMYVPFECGMKSGTARVYDHEIPGGQYSNCTYVSC